MSIYYTYQLTHKTTGQFYIGSHICHRTDDPYKDLGIKYKSSSEVVEKMGFENFNISNVEIYPSHNLAWWHEQYLIWENYNNSLNLNEHYIHPFTGKHIFSNAGKPRSKEHSLKISLALKGRTKSIEHRQKLREARKHQITTLETRQKMSLARKGKKRSIETCLKMSKSKTGLRWKQSKPRNEEHCRKISKAKRQKNSSRL